MTRSEAFVYRLSKSTFLSLWTYPNPRRPSGVELCDILVVCQPDIIIISVKEVTLKKGPAAQVEQDRWLKHAVDSSVKQIYGAERQLQSMSTVIAADGTLGVDLGVISARSVHRIAVAIGSDGSIPIESRDHGKGFIHVFDEHDIYLILNELDTVTDVIKYLADREAFFQNGLTSVLSGNEDDLLAVYLSSNRSFGELTGEGPAIRIILGAWADYAASSEYALKKNADEDSYIWDTLIDILHDDFASGNIEFGDDLESIDRSTRVMAREDRFQRRLLGKQFLSFISDPTVLSRFVPSPSGLGCVFLKRRHGEGRRFRTAELAGRCYVARDMLAALGQPGPVVGLATEVPEKGSGFSLDCILLDCPIWDADAHSEAIRLQEQFGYFRAPTATRFSEDEYPRSRPD